MKKLIGSLIVLSALLMSVPANAQLKFGVEGGLNLTKASFSEDALNSDNRTGWFFGPKLQLTIPVINFTVDGAVLYSQKRVNESTDQTVANTVTVGTSSSKTMKSVEIPINARYTFGLGDALGLYVSTGPEFGFNVGGKKWNDSWGDYTLKDSYMSWNIGAGVMLVSHLQLGLGYNFPIGKSGENKSLTDYKKVDFKTKTFQVMATYYF